MRQQGFFIIILFLITSCTSPTQTPNPTSTSVLSKAPEPTHTHTETPTPTETNIPVFSLSGTIFFDYNGSGEQDIAYSMDIQRGTAIDEPKSEPSLSSIQVCLAIEDIDESSQDNICTSSDENGIYTIKDIKAGNYYLYVKPLSNDTEIPFRHILVSKGWVEIPAYQMNEVQVPTQYVPNTMIQPIETPIQIDLNENMEFNIGLVQGIFTMPIAMNEPHFLNGFVDLDIELGKIRDFKNESDPFISYWTLNLESALKPGTWDQHQGIDINCTKGKFTLAMAPGIVVYDYHNVTVEHNIGGTSFVIQLSHGLTNLVSVGDYVHRGQIIGLCGGWLPWGGETNPHIHINHFIVDESESYDKSLGHHSIVQYIFDPDLYPHVLYPNDMYVPFVDDIFRDITNPISISLWTVDNQPQYANSPTNE